MPQIVVFPPHVLRCSLQDFPSQNSDESGGSFICVSNSWRKHRQWQVLYWQKLKLHKLQKVQIQKCQRLDYPFKSRTAPRRCSLRHSSLWVGKHGSWFDIQHLLPARLQSHMSLWRGLLRWTECEPPACTMRDQSDLPAPSDLYEVVFIPKLLFRTSHGFIVWPEITV